MMSCSWAFGDKQRTKAFTVMIHEYNALLIKHLNKKRKAEE